MRIDLVSPVLPPTLDGIGDHSAHLSEALAAQGADVRVLTGQRDWTPLSEVRVQRGFYRDKPRDILELVEPVCADPPDVLLVQFEQFSYGRWGFNPFLPLALRRIQDALPGTEIAVMFHEDFTPCSSVAFAVMSLWQRPQFWMLGRLADTAFFSTEPWADKYRDWFPNTNVHHLPVGSNIPDKHASPRRVSRRLDLAPEALTLGLFGSAHPSRLLSYVNDAAVACAQKGHPCQVLYVGPDGERVREVLAPNVSLRDAGALAAPDVSRCFAAMDLYLAPFQDGVSTRRGSFLTGLQHGLPTVSTVGRETGQLLRHQDGSAFSLAPASDGDAFVSRVLSLADAPERRSQLGRAARRLYASTFDWPNIATSLRRGLTTAQARRTLAVA